MLCSLCFTGFSKIENFGSTAFILNIYQMCAISAIGELVAGQWLELLIEVFRMNAIRPVKSRVFIGLSEFHAEWRILSSQNFKQGSLALNTYKHYIIIMLQWYCLKYFFLKSLIIIVTNIDWVLTMFSSLF